SFPDLDVRNGSYTGWEDIEFETRWSQSYREHHFIDYAARYWGEHCQGTPEMSESVRTPILSLLASESKRASILKWRYGPKFLFSALDHNPRTVTFWSDGYCTF